MLRIEASQIGITRGEVADFLMRYDVTRQRQRQAAVDAPPMYNSSQQQVKIRRGAERSWAESFTESYTELSSPSAIVHDDDELHASQNEGLCVDEDWHPAASARRHDSVLAADNSNKDMHTTPQVESSHPALPVRFKARSSSDPTEPHPVVVERKRAVTSRRRRLEVDHGDLLVLDSVLAEHSPLDRLAFSASHLDVGNASISSGTTQDIIPFPDFEDEEYDDEVGDDEHSTSLTNEVGSTTPTAQDRLRVFANMFRTSPQYQQSRPVSSHASYVTARMSVGNTPVQHPMEIRSALMHTRHQPLPLRDFAVTGGGRPSLISPVNRLQVQRPRPSASQEEQENEDEDSLLEEEARFWQEQLESARRRGERTPPREGRFLRLLR